MTPLSVLNGNEHSGLRIRRPKFTSHCSASVSAFVVFVSKKPNKQTNNQKQKSLMVANFKEQALYIV